VTGVRGTRRRWLVTGVLVVVLVAALTVAWPSARVYTGVAPPPQFSEALDPALPTGHSSVLGVAHNAGNNPGTTATALRHGADVIEIDVISARGQPVAGREQQWRWLAERVFRGPTLAEAWDDAAAAGILKLDLQQNDVALLDDVVALVAPRSASRRVMISTRDAAALLYLRPRLPHVMLLFSAAFPEAVGRLRSEPALLGAIGGVSAFEGLVDPALVAWAHRQGLLVLAWTVNDGERLRAVVDMGVDGVTTANLEVLQALA
jgi:glycerophosphoryl diester phosphodiesterase